MANKIRWNPEARASDFYRMYCTRMSYGGGGGGRQGFQL